MTTVPEEGACRRCGYPLVGIDDRAACPECGLLAGLSRLPADELRHDRPAWLAKLVAGAWCVVAGLVCLPLVFVGTAFGPRLPHELAAATAAGLAPGVVLLAAGVWLLNSRRDARHRVGPLGWWLRIVVLLPIASAAWQAVFAYQRRTADVELIAAYLAFPSALALLAWPLLIHLGRLARQAPAPLLAGDAPWLGVVASASWASIIALTAWSALGVGGDLNSLAGVLLLLAIVVSVIASYLWLIYLFIRAALAFAKPMRQAAELWAASDLADQPH